MHEASLAQGVLDTALGALPDKRVRIRKIIVVAGVFSGVSGDCLELYVRELARGTAAEGAALEVRRKAAELVCPACDSRQPYDNVGDLEPRCPRCGGPRRIEGGNELYVESLEIEE